MRKRWKESVEKWSRTILWSWGAILSYTSFARLIHEMPQHKILLIALGVAVMLCIFITGCADLKQRFAKKQLKEG